MAEVVLKPGEVLVVRCLGDGLDVYAGPDGEPSDGTDDAVPEIGESLEAFGVRASGGASVSPDHPMWPRGADGEPVPGTHIWDGALWVPPDAS